MALSVNIDGLIDFLAQTILGGKTDDQKDMAGFAVDLALQEISANSKLVSQEAEGTLTLTSVGTYNISDIDPQLLRVHKAWTPLGDVSVMRKAEFVSRFPNFSDFSAGIPRHLVLWGNNSLLVWPDQDSTTLNVLYYRLLKAEHAGEILFALKTLGQKYLETDKDTRNLNFMMGKDAVNSLNKTSTRASDSPIRFRPEHRVTMVNQHKRMRKWGRY